MSVINVYSLNADPREISFVLQPEELSLEGDAVAQGPARIRGEIYRLGEKIYFRGRVEAELRLTCSRCLKEFDYPVSAPLLLVALPAEAPARPAEAGGRSGEEPDATLTYAHEQLDLRPEIRTALILAVPMKPLCREDCRGLCAACGRPLDTGCGCGETVADSPFAVLQKLQAPPRTDGNGESG